MKNALINLGLSVASGLLFGLSWPEIGNAIPLIFVAFVPLMFMEERVSADQRRFKGFRILINAYLAFLIFNVLTTWWIMYASFEGMIMAEVFNSLFMALVFLLFHWTRKRVGNKEGYLALVIYWLAFEWVHINWELSWTWLTLGNVFASNEYLVQWYEYTGVLGGSFWVLLLNVFALMSFKTKGRMIQQPRGIIAAVGVALPCFISMAISLPFEEKEAPVDVVVVQPNIDPYKEKFNGMHEYDQIDKMINLSRPLIDEKTDFVVGPETAFPMGYWEHELREIYGTKELFKLMEEHPGLRYITGLSTIKLYGAREKQSPTARPFTDGSGNAYDYYNTVMQVSGKTDLQLYHKSKLVLGVEKMPFAGYFDFMEKLSINLGGASGSLGTEPEALNFKASTGSRSDIDVAATICYESIYGEYVTEFVQKGAQLLIIVTNDGWWKDTPGYRQHLAYAKLRAIECRRAVARSANTGISAFINQKGEVLQKTNWWEDDAIKATLNANDELTFYVRYGDFVGRVASFIALLLLALTIVRTINKKTEGIR